MNTTIFDVKSQPNFRNDNEKKPENKGLNQGKVQYVKSGYGQVSETLIQNGFTPMPTFGGKSPARYGGWINVNNIALHSDPDSPVYNYILQERKRPPQLGDLYGYRIGGWQTFTPEKLKSPDYLEKYNQKRGISHLEEYNQWRAISGAGVCILTGESAGNLFAFDIDWVDDELTEEARLVIEDILGGYGDIVMRRGSKGLCAFLRLEDGFYLGKDLDCSAGNIDLLYNGKQSVIPPSIHPTSDKPYVWLTERTLLNTELDQLPIVTEELWLELIEALEGLVGPITGKERRSAPTQSFDYREFEDSFDRWVATEALKVADDWIKDLGLARLDQVGDDFWVAVPSFRSSSTGRPDSQRTQNLHFTPKLIVDRGGSFRHWPLDRLVAECLGLSIDEAWHWLYERVPALKLPDWEPAPIPVIARTEPEAVEDEQPYDPALAAYEEEQEALYANDYEDERNESDIPVIPPAAKLPEQTIEYDEAGSKTKEHVQMVVTRSEANRVWLKGMDELKDEYKEATSSKRKSEILDSLREKALLVPRGTVIKAQTGIGKSRIAKEILLAAASTKDANNKRLGTTGMFFFSHQLISEQHESLDDGGQERTWVYQSPHNIYEVIPSEKEGEKDIKIRWCSHPNRQRAKDLKIPIDRLCENGGEDGARCPNYDNCPLRKNNEEIRKRDHHMMAAHSSAFAPVSKYTGTFKTLVFDEEILTASMAEEINIDQSCLTIDRLCEDVRSGYGEYDDLDREANEEQVEDVLKHLKDAFAKSLKDHKRKVKAEQEEQRKSLPDHRKPYVIGADEAPLDFSYVNLPITEIAKASDFLLDHMKSLQNAQLLNGFVEVDLDKKIAAGEDVKDIDLVSNKVNRLLSLINLLNEVMSGLDAGIGLSGRILINVDDGSVILRQKKALDHQLLKRGYPALLDATLHDVDVYQGMFDFDFQVDDDIYIRVRREFDVLTHDQVARADTVKVIQVTGAPVSATRLNLGGLAQYGNPSRGRENRENVRAVIDVLTEEARDESMLICHKDFNKWMGKHGGKHQGFLSTGNLAGTNGHEEDKVGIIVGHARLSPDEPFKHIGRLTGEYCTDKLSTKVKRTIKLADGSTKTVDSYQLNDEKVEAYSQYLAQRAFVQGVGRLRPLTDKGFEQVVFVLTDEDTGLLIDQQIEWKDLRDPVKALIEDREISEMLEMRPVSTSWKVNQGLKIKHPVACADRLKRFIDRDLLNFTKEVYPYNIIIKHQSSFVKLNRFAITPLEGGKPSDVYFTSEEALQEYLSKQELPYKIQKSVEWIDDAVALTHSDIKSQYTLSDKKTSELSNELSANIPPSHAVIEFKTLTNGVAPQGRWRRAAVRVGVDPVEAIQNCLSLSAVVVRRH